MRNHQDYRDSTFSSNFTSHSYNLRQLPHLINLLALGRLQLLWMRVAPQCEEQLMSTVFKMALAKKLP